MVSNNIDKLSTAINTLLESGVSDSDSAPLSIQAKVETLALAKEIRRNVKPAIAEIKGLSDDQRDELALKYGYEMFRVLEGK